MSDEQELLPKPSHEVRQWAMFCHLSPCWASGFRSAR